MTCCGGCGCASCGNESRGFSSNVCFLCRYLATSYKHTDTATATHTHTHTHTHTQARGGVGGYSFFLLSSSSSLLLLLLLLLLLFLLLLFFLLRARHAFFRNEPASALPRERESEREREPTHLHQPLPCLEMSFEVLHSQDLVSKSK